MSKTLLEPLLSIRSLLPADWTGVSESEQVNIQDGLKTVLLDLGCKCNGEKRAIDSAATTIRERIKALAMTRQVESNIKEVARSRGVDVDTASSSMITTSLTPDEINALIAVSSILTSVEIDLLVSDKEKATIAQEEISTARTIRDHQWERDLSQFVRRAAPHGITVQVTNLDTDVDLLVVETVSVKLDTIRPEVDDNGEICAWIYEEG